MPAPPAGSGNGARKVVVAKQGEYGAALFTERGFFSLPGYPLETVLDPTGAGDTFAGGFLGYLSAHAGEPFTDDLLRRAMTYGSVLASFNVEEFGTERIQRLTDQEIHDALPRVQGHDSTSRLSPSRARCRRERVQTTGRVDPAPRRSALYRARPGSSSSPFRSRRNCAAVAPSSARWSQESVMSMRGRTTACPSSATTRSLDSADREDRDLRRVEHGDEPLDPVHAEVRDRERAADEVLRNELVLARAPDDLDALGGQLGDGLRLDGREDGDDEAVRHGDGHADVHRAEDVHLAVHVVGVDGRVLERARPRRAS